MKRQSKYPFLYYGHGSAYANKSIFCSIIFKDKLTSKEIAFIKRNLPNPLIERVSHHHNCLLIYSSDTYDVDALSYTGKKFDGDEFELWNEFENIIELKLLEIHKKLSIISVYKTSVPNYGSSFSSWHYYSIENLSNLFLPVFKKSIDLNDNRDAVSEDYFYMLFGYTTSYLDNKYPLTKRNTFEICNLITLIIRLKIDKADKYFIYSAITVLSKILSNLSKAEYGKYFVKLPLAVKVKMIIQDNCSYLFNTESTLDIIKLEGLCLDVTPNEESIIADLFSELVACEKMQLRKNSQHKKFIFTYLINFINTGNLSESLAVNILYLCSKANRPEQKIADTLISKIKEIIGQRADLQNSKYINDNLSLLGVKSY